MSVSCFTSTNSHLCKFLRTTGRDWRNTIYVPIRSFYRTIRKVLPLLQTPQTKYFKKGFAAESQPHSDGRCARRAIKNG